MVLQHEIHMEKFHLKELCLKEQTKRAGLSGRREGLTNLSIGGLVSVLQRLQNVAVEVRVEVTAGAQTLTARNQDLQAHREQMLASLIRFERLIKPGSNSISCFTLHYSKKTTALPVSRPYLMRTFKL